MPHQRVVGVEKTLDVYFMQSEQLLDKLTRLQLLWSPPSGNREEPQDKPEWVSRTAGRGCRPGHYEPLMMNLSCVVASAVFQLCVPMYCSLPASSVHRFSRREY